MPAATRTAPAPAIPGFGAEVFTLLRHSTHYFLGVVGLMGIGFVSFPIFTRLLTVADYGLIDLAQKVVVLGVAAAKMGLQNSALRLYDARRFSECEDDARTYYSTMVAGVGSIALLVALALVAVLLPRREYIFCLAATLILLRALESILWTFLRVEGRTSAYNYWSVGMRAGTVVLICLIFFYSGPSATAFFIGTITVEASVVLALGYGFWRRGLLTWNVDSSLLRVAVAFGMPLMLYEFSSIVLDFGDRILVRYFLGADSLGYYSVAYNISSYVQDLLTVPLNLAVVPIYMKIWNAEGAGSTGEFLRRSFDLFVMIAAAVLATVIVASRDALTILASSKYKGAAPLIPALATGLLVYTANAFLSAGLLIHKQTLTMAKIVFASTALNIVLNCVMLPRMGLQAAALATLLSYAFCIAVLERKSSALLPLNLEFHRIPKYLLAAGISAVVAWQWETGRPVVDLAVKSALSLVVYVAVLAVIDRRSRVLIGSAKCLRRPTSSF